ncbi:SecDF P1 head subdomain-containing protein [Taibaiella koreensis]|uniref:SecDF P1 head subdomain-containing protein n=1 Tax=Taibaiella koreensis TaxID=1268548 RepID=UPI0013C3163B|nr:hypothetical protein [Taibaiella koreensis]
MNKISVRPGLMALTIPVLLLSASCHNTMAPKGGLKVSLVTDYRALIRDMAGYPEDMAFQTALDSAFHDSGVPHKVQISNFIRYYNALQPGKQATSLFYSGDSKGFTGDQALADHLAAALSNADRRMDQVIKARAEAFFNPEAINMRVAHTSPTQTDVYLPGAKDEETVRAMFRHQTGVRFWATADIETLGPSLVRLNDSLQHIPVITTTAKKEGEPSLQEMVDHGAKVQAASLFALLMPALGQDGKPYGASYIGIASIEDTAKLHNVLNGPVSIAILPKGLRWLWGNLPGTKQDQKAVALYAIYVPRDEKAPVGGTDIKSARGDMQGRGPEISLEMTEAGGRKWATMTRSRIGKAIAIELDNFIYSAPLVNEEIRGGRSAITGAFSEAEMEDLVKVLNAGTFPLPFRIVSIQPYSANSNP